MSGDGYFATRLAHDRRRTILWKSLYRYHFSRFIRPSDTVVDLGCGYGDFINAVVAQRRLAVDAWAGAHEYLEEGIEFRADPIDDLAFLDNRSVDFAFASNVFEHVSQSVFRTVLGELRRVLTADGTLCILQPNYLYAYRQYFDDYTHVAVYSHVSLCDFLRSEGFEILHCSPRFLPLSIKSALPIHPLLIRLYLLSPLKLLGRQMLIRCRPLTRNRDAIGHPNDAPTG